MRPSLTHERLAGTLKTRRTGDFAHFTIGSLAAVVVAAGLLLSISCAQAPRPILLTPDQRALELASFDQVWTTIRDKHWDPQLGGLNWEALRDSLRPKVEQAQTRAASRSVMQALIASLEQSHFAVYSSEVFPDLQTKGGDGSPGFELRLISGRPVVWELFAGSPAESLGVRPGWVLTRAGDREIDELLERIRPQFEGKSIAELMLTTIIAAHLTGPIGSELDAEFLDDADRERSLMIRRIKPRGAKTQLGHLPAAYAWTDVQRLPGDIGYVRVSMFLDPEGVMGKYNEAMQSFLDCRGVIVDLRGNPGGLALMAMGMAGWLIEGEGRRLGVMQTRDTEMKFTINPRPQTFSGLVAVLVDGLSASTSEIFAGGLQGLGRARVFGAPTAGAALPSVIEKLPNGDGFQYAVANYVSEGGEMLEENGVTPDVAVELTRAALLAGHDPICDAAAAWIRESR